MRYSLVLSFLAASTFMIAACGDDGTSTAGGACVDYTSVTGSPSFKDDVMPIFQLACGLSSVCHESGSGATSAEELELGPKSGDPLEQATIDAVHAAIVGQTSTRAKAPLVDPGNPAGSWLMAKLEYASADLGACGIDCASTAKGCGTAMPQNSPALDAGSLDTIRAWIKAGAENN